MVLQSLLMWLLEAPVWRTQNYVSMEVLEVSVALGGFM